MKEFIYNTKFAWKYARGQKKNLIWFSIINIFLIIISIIVPILSSNIIVKLTENKLIQLVFIALIIFIIENIRNFLHFYQTKHAQRIYRETFINVQTDLGKNILRLENNIIDKNSSGLFIQRLTNDTSKLADVFTVFNLYLTRIITDLGIFVVIFIINKWIFLYLVFFVIIRYLIEKRRVKLYNENDKKYRKLHENASGFVGEMVRGIRDIKMLNCEDNFINTLHNKIVNLNQSRYDMNEINRKYVFIRGFFRDLSDYLLIILLVLLIKNNSLTLATSLVIYNYSGRIPGIIDNIAILLDNVKDFNLSSKRVFNIINSDEFKKETFSEVHLDKVKGNFEFKDVTFKYDSSNLVLDNISFKIKSNETVAFVGKTGSGKTTIFNLLAKMYDVQDGEILIDGININNLDKESIRNNITIISQNPYIFNLSIKDNLKLVKEDVSDSEIKKACKIACLDDFIENLPNKYETIIGEGGVNLSGGEKQRLAIARALIQNTEIILFDEATSALDNETQERITKAINNMKSKYTILIIAHRLSTIKNVDRILFLDNGKIVSEGSHNKLLKKSKEYKELYQSEIIKEL